MKGLVKVSRPKAKPARAAAAKTKVRTAKTSARKSASSGSATKKSATATIRTAARSGTATTKKAAAKKAAPKMSASKTTGAAKSASRATAAIRKMALKAVAGTKTATGRTAPKNAAAKGNGAANGSSKSPPRPSVSAEAKSRAAAQRAREVALEMAAREKELAREHSTTAVNRALSLLETLARTGPVPLAVLADAAGCGKTAASDLLTTMQGRNFVIQDESHGLWRLGARWAVLGSAASEQGALAATAMPYLASLGNATGENVYLRVREGMESETVAIYQTDPGLRVYTEVGKKMPLHAGSGRILLAHAPEAVQTQVLAQRLQRYTPSTRIDPSWIAADLHRIRTRGFLITDSEVVAGTVSVAAPVRDASGQVVASILIGAPSLRMRPPRPRALMPAVVEAARKLSHALGSISDQPATAVANGSADPRPLGAFTGSPWPSTALGATITRPHSIFR